MTHQIMQLQVLMELMEIREGESFIFRQIYCQIVGIFSPMVVMAEPVVMVEMDQQLEPPVAELEAVAAMERVVAR